MSTPNLGGLMEDVTAAGLSRLTRYASLRSAGFLRSLPEDILREGEDARVLIVRGVFFRREAVAAFASDRNTTIELRPDPANEHDPFAVAVDLDGVHAGFLPKEVACEFQPMVTRGNARVAASWADFSGDVPLIYLLVAWSDGSSASVE